MASKVGSFDADAFYEALDATRQSRGLSWKEVAEGSGVSASTLTRMAQGKRPDLDGFAALATWSGLPVDQFIRIKGSKRRPEPEPLALISAQIKGDDQLTPEAATALTTLIKATYERLRNDAGE